MKNTFNLLTQAACSTLSLLAFTGLGSPVSATPVIPAPTEPVPTRVLVNPSFEEPSFTDYPGAWISLDNYIPGDDDTLQGWFSTHPTRDFPGFGRDRFNNRRGRPFRHLTELWVDGHNGVRPAGGYQFAELNAQAHSALYQDILVFAGESIPWEVSHRGRDRESVADVMEVFISDPNDWNGATFAGNKLYSANISTSSDGSVAGITPSLGNIANSTSAIALSDGWVRYSDIWEGPAQSQKYRFAFQAISTAGGNLAQGNLLDEIQIKLSPIIDIVDPKIAEIDPFGESTYYLPIRVNGMLESNATVEINVSVAGIDSSNFTLANLMSGSAQLLGNDFSVTKLANGNISLTIPPNLYDPNNPAHYISVPIDFKDAIVSRESEVLFTVVDVQGGGGNGVQDLLIPPADSGFSATQNTVLKPYFLD